LSLLQVGSTSSRNACSPERLRKALATFPKADAGRFEFGIEELVPRAAELIDGLAHPQAWAP
jgi:hypothetical protein